MKEFLSSKGIEFSYFDITGNILYLRSFLKIRDTREEYNEIKEKGRVGIPVVVVDDRLFFTPEEVDVDWILAE